MELNVVLRRSRSAATPAVAHVKSLRVSIRQRSKLTHGCRLGKINFRRLLTCTKKETFVCTFLIKYIIVKVQDRVQYFGILPFRTFLNVRFVFQKYILIKLLCIMWWSLINRDYVAYVHIVLYISKQEHK